MSFKFYNSSGNELLVQGVADLPIGAIKAYGGTTAPTGWLLCDGSAVSRTAYPDLYSAIGTNFGTGDGSTTFNVPDLRGRVPVGLDNLGGTDIGRLDVANTLGGSGGEQKHKLTIAEIPSHSHQEIARYAGTGAANGLTLNTANNAIYGTNDQTGLTGGDGFHENMPPYLLVGWIIYAQKISTRIAVVQPPQQVSSLPSNPIDGQEIYYFADSTSGIIWHLKYRAAARSGAGAWEFLGGPPIYDQQLPEEFVSAANQTWVGVSANDPIVTVPLAGDYFISSQCTLKAAAAAASVFIGFRVNGITDPTPDVSTGGGYCSVLGARATVKYEQVYTSAIAGNTFAQRYWHNQGSTANLGRSAAITRLTPIRVWS